jgi:hypothetical protein
MTKGLFTTRKKLIKSTGSLQTETRQRLKRIYIVAENINTLICRYIVNLITSHARNLNTDFLRVAGLLDMSDLQRSRPKFDAHRVFTCQSSQNSSDENDQFAPQLMLEVKAYFFNHRAVILMRFSAAPRNETQAALPFMVVVPPL